MSRIEEIIEKICDIFYVIGMLIVMILFVIVAFGALLNIII